MPSELSNLSLLIGLCIDNNLVLTGELPTELNILTNLVEFWMVETTDATGNLSVLCDVTTNPSISADYDEVPCPCCYWCRQNDQCGFVTE